MRNRGYRGGALLRSGSPRATLGGADRRRRSDEAEALLRRRAAGQRGMAQPVTNEGAWAPVERPAAERFWIDVDMEVAMETGKPESGTNPNRRHKAKHGQGGVWPVIKDGRVVRYRWEIMVGYLPDGRKDVRRGSATTEREALKLMRQIAVKKDTNTLPKASAVKGTVGDLLTAYLAAKKLEASPKTYKKEEQFASLHIIPQIGKVKQEKLTAADVRSLLAKLADEGLAVDTIRGIRGTLARALDQAVIDDVLPRNVARLERKRRSRRAERTGDDKYAFTPAEVRLILKRTRTDRFHQFWAFLLYTGVRFGEAAALTWRDADLDARQVVLARSLEKAANGTPIFSDPKTYASRRTIRIPAALVELLKAHRKAQATEKMDARTVAADGSLIDGYHHHD
ncbi:MAG: hypothetical protein ACRDI2_19660, partial [Chloroflexota bacterium]